MHHVFREQCRQSFPEVVERGVEFVRMLFVCTFIRLKC